MTRKRITILVAAVVGIGLVGFTQSQANAADPWGVGIRIGGSTVQFGHSHHGYHPRTSYYGSRGYYGHHRGHHRGHHGRGHYDWHDTSHYDYHPPEIRWHGNHYHYTPGHYHFHRDGHWDYHRGRHHSHHWGH